MLIFALYFLFFLFGFVIGREVLKGQNEQEVDMLKTGYELKIEQLEKERRDLEVRLQEVRIMLATTDPSPKDGTSPIKD